MTDFICALCHKPIPWDGAFATMDSGVYHVDCAYRMGERETRSKMGNRYVELDGRKFHSIAEAARYKELKMLETVGEISRLRCQVAMPLREAVTLDGVRGKPVSYIADFEYLRHKDNVTVIEDVKGFKTDTYKDKLGMILNVIKARQAAGERVIFQEIPASDYSGNAARGRRNRKGRR